MEASFVGPAARYHEVPMRLKDRGIASWQGSVTGAEQLTSLHGTLEASARNWCVWFLLGESVPRCPRLLWPVLPGGPSTMLESGKVWVGAGYHLPAQDADPINFSEREKRLLAL